jgi:hypothetical protein
MSNQAYTMTISNGAIKPIKTRGTFPIREKIGRRIAKCAIKSPMQLAQNDHMCRNHQWVLNAYPKTIPAVTTATDQSFLNSLGGFLW